MKSKKNHIKIILECTILIFSLLLLSPQKVEAMVTATLMTVKEDTTAREKADDSSKKIFELKKGDNVIAGKKEGNCYVVIKDGKEAYVEASKIEIAESDEKLVEELNELAVETEKDINLVYQYRKEATRSKIWGTVVIVLVLSIFGIGIYSTIKKKKN